MVSPADIVTWPYRAVRSAVVAYRLWRQLQADADARICLGFKRQQEILSEQLREAQARGDASEEQRVRQMLHRVQDNELAYHQSRMADLAAHVVADRAPSSVIVIESGHLPPREGAALERAASTWAALEPPRSFADRLMLGNAFHMAGDFERSLTEYDAALELRHADPDALAGRGIVLLHLGRAEEALDAFQRSLASRPEDRDALAGLGSAMDSLHRHGEALDAHNRALARDPHQPVLLNNRGLALACLQRYEEALADFNRALELRPGNPNTLYNIACLHSLWERYDESLQWLEKAISGDPKYRAAARADEDFAGLKAHPELGPRFQKLIAEETS